MSVAESGPIFVVNDHEWTARSIETLLVAAGHRTVRAFTGAQLEALLAVDEPDALILDLQLPDTSSLDLLPRLKREGVIGPALPVILTTAGPSGRQMRLRAADAGAWEFFGQPLDGGALLAKLEVFLAAYRHTKAVTSSRLGLHTGAALEQRVAELGALARRAGLPVSCVTLTIDGTASPGVESCVAAALRQSGRSGDALGRLGAGHYVVLAYGADAAGAERLAERMRGVIATVDAAITPRIRLVNASPADSPESLLAAASAALAA